MRHYILNVKSLMFLFAIVLLTYGAQGISYGAVCKAGDILSPGESCTYPGTNAVFSVLNNGQSQWNIPGLPWWLAWVNKISLDELSVSDLTVNGVRYDFAASKQADGTWFIETVGNNSTPPPVSNPDLVVGQPTVSQSTLAPGGSFTLSATAANNGAGSAAATTLRYYRSTNATITTSDTEVGTDSVSALGANQSSAESITLTAPSSPGTYYYGACVEAVTGESSSDNNCSTAVSITVQQSTEPPGQTTYSVGEDIPTLPTGSWYPDTVLGSGGGASVVISGGKTTITFGNGGAIREDGITYTCVAAGGCTVEGRRVTGGTIQTSGGEQTPPSAQQPDLVVQQPTVSQSTLAPGENFTLSATVANNGAGSAAATTLRYYRSTNATITTRDTEVGKDSVGALGSNQSSAESISLTAPSSPGTYYYGACVEAVTGESSSNNNCSAAVSLTVQQTPVVPTPSHPFIYWTDHQTDKIHRANLDGSNVQDLVTKGLNFPGGIALDVAGGKMYWSNQAAAKIQCANLDGSNIENLVTGLREPFDIALDIVGGKMYWTDWGTNKIQRASLNGSNIEDLVTTGLETPLGIALDVAAGKMYWTDNGTNKIQRANLDGSNVQDLVTRGLETPGGIALDVAGGKMYWTNSGAAKIQRANLDGSNIEDLVTRTQGLMDPWDIALDVAGGKMYWTDTGTGKIQRANLDGSNIEDLVTRTQGLMDPWGIAIAIPASQQPSPQPDLVLEAVQAVPTTVAPGEKFRLYATLKNQGTAQSAATTVRYYRSTDNVISTTDTQLGTGNRNPLAPNDTLRRYLSITAPTTPGTYYYGVCVDSVTNESNTTNNCSAAVTVTVTAPVVSTDVNNDGAVDVQDLVYVAQRYGQTGTTRADVNTDGVVNINDLILVAEVLDADTAAAPSVHPGALETLTVADVKLWLSDARQLDLTDPRVQRGILFLEQLLMVLVPKETALLANYPNPFNPETWIPYHLANDTDVSLSIYDINGALVRELDLGHQRAGYYTDRSRAAYWDGRNTLGEPVASGVYFYQFRAGDYLQMRKMVILK